MSPYMCPDNRRGVLCGSCRHDYSTALTGPACVKDSECFDIAWLAPVGFLLLAAFAAYLCSVHNDTTAATLRIVFYFYQIASLLVIGGAEQRSLHFLIGLFNFQLNVPTPSGNSSAVIALP